ncbi:gamma carbonic anhydrase family protein [Thermocladium modestius]|uniref:gamma carbonic anhydrase family protein n=1 Tax=Thermocladium modestius TaxID=62609 RepID=UPI00166DF011|nr:gamma carbonic anhydrase family protein [Thermocladium modestius]
MPILRYKDKLPRIGKNVLIPSSAYVIGDVEIGDNVSLWPFVVIRGDEDRIVIGDNSNIQDLTVIHTDKGIVTQIGSGVTIGHRAIVHGAKVGNNVLIGMGAILLNNSVIGDYSIIGAGAVVTEGMVIPPYSIAVGVPAKVIKTVDEESKLRIINNYKAYLELAREYVGIL